MATLHAQGLLLSAAWRPLSSSRRSGGFCRASLRLPAADYRQMITVVGEELLNGRVLRDDTVVVTKMHAIADAAADRAEMHDIIGRQRDNWNHLFLHSTNSLLLAASVMAALAPASPALLPLKVSSGALLASAAAMLTMVNRIQPSQLAEEQRKATQLWRQLEREIHTALKFRTPSQGDVDETMDKVLALDKAYPLPLLPGMLEKFPKAIEPTRWWPRKHHKKAHKRSPASSGRRGSNGWSQVMEDEMRGILRVLKAKDEEQYMSVGGLVLRIHKSLAVAGPVISGMAAVAAGFIGSSSSDMGTWASGAAVIGGVLAAVVNTAEHGGQLGMMFELLRNCGGYYRKLQEEIEANLEEGEVERRDDGEVFATKVALQLGRSPSSLREFAVAASPEFKDEHIKDFAGKLF